MNLLTELLSKDSFLNNHSTSSSENPSQIAQKQIKLWELIRHQMATQKPDDVIHDGYGEYIITINRQPADFITFFAVSKILQAHSPAVWAQKALPAKDRLPELRRKIAAIDPRIQLSFIPRCLYELILIKKILKDEADALRSVYFEDPSNPTEEELRTWKVHCVEKISPWTDSLYTTVINQAFEMNNILSEIVHNSGKLTKREIVKLAEESIDYIKNICSKKWIDLALKSLDLLDECHFHPLFGIFTDNQINKSFQELILKVISLECCPATIGKIIFYRGASFYQDHTQRISSSADLKPHSLSFGTGVFTGIIRDEGATPFCYMSSRYFDLTGYALVFSPRKAKEIFTVPTEYSILQIYGRGEFFHGRSKITKPEKPEEEVSGVNASGNNPRIQNLISKLSSETLEKTFLAYKGAAIFLS